MIVDNGKWWMPADPDRTAAGNLSTTDDGSLRLELDQHLVPWTVRNAVVWGETADATPVTLLGVLPFGKMTQEEIYVHAALLGVHITSADDAIFRQAAVSLSNLTDWATRGRDGLPLPEQVNNPELPGERLSLRGEGTEVQLVIESEEPRRWAGFGTTTQAFQDLLTLAGNADCRIESSVLFTGEGRPVQVWMKADTVIEHHWHPVFGLSTVPAQFISAWLKLRTQLGMSGSVLFSLDYGGRGYFQNKLFNAASAAEGIHHILHPGATGISAQAHKDLKDHIKKLPDGEAKNWALSTIRRNPPGFTTRMRELAAIPDGEAVERLLHDQDKWVTWMVNARNSIGHSSWGGMDKIPHEVRPALTHVTKTLLHLVLLEKLGLSADQQRSAVAVSYHRLRQPYDDYFDPPPTAPT